VTRVRFVADQAQLARALQQVTRIVSPQNTLPALAGVRIEVGESGDVDGHGSVRLSATDLTSQISVEVLASGVEPGGIILPASTLTDLVLRVPTAEVRIEADATAHRATIAYGRNRTTLSGFAVQEMPQFPPRGSEAVEFELPPGALARLARQTVFATAHDESRPVLKGAHVRVADGKLVMVGTDGTRLSHSWVALPEYRGEAFEFVMSQRALAEAARLAGAEAALLVKAGNQLEIRAQGGTLVTLLLEGRYPDYQRVLPEQYVTRIRVDTDRLRGAVERVNLIAHKDRAGSIRLSYHAGVLEVQSEAVDVGQAYELVEVEGEGQAMDLSFSPALLLDGIKSLETERMALDLAGLEMPARLSEVDGSSYFHIVLPLRQIV
jgi:DNA polymerase-3 subunit beta